MGEKEDGRAYAGRCSEYVCTDLISDDSINAIVYRRYTQDIEKTVLDYSGDTVRKISENMTDSVLALEEKYDV